MTVPTPLELYEHLTKPVEEGGHGLQYLFEQMWWKHTGHHEMPAEQGYDPPHGHDYPFRYDAEGNPK